MLNPLDAILETWNRNTNVVLNILNALPEGGIDARDTNGQWTVAHHLSDMQGANIYWLEKSSPEFAVGLTVLYREDESLPAGFDPERDLSKIKTGFQNAADAVARAVRHHLETQTPFGEVYEHPIFFLQHMIWHQAYHLGQIIWALKQSGMRFSDDQTFDMIWKELRR
jgi:uncharacterized damage-inducible protein DinB